MRRSFRNFSMAGTINTMRMIVTTIITVAMIIVHRRHGGISMGTATGAGITGTLTGITAATTSASRNGIMGAG